ncbi:MAG TPA: histidine kinase [Steroidobacteraceae bacterium]|nr:histidine kinase [Steroidobacteraceae bacterium]
MANHPSPAPAHARGLARVFSWQRLRFTLAVAAGLGALVGTHSPQPLLLEVFRGCVMGCVILFAYGALESRPRKLPPWLPRTVLRLIGVTMAIPIAAMFMAALYPPGKNGLGALVGAGLLFAPWIAVASIFRQRDALAREQTFAFELERSEYERRESDARLRQLQAQVEPHFLFNTLANVQSLVDSGSPQASKVLSSLIAYLRASVPRMHRQDSAIADEVDLVRAYLEIMQMRMPDRLQYNIHLDPAVARRQCPPMALLTLVENAVRHGIDPSEAGGRIDVDVWMRDRSCVMRVSDTGVGLKTLSRGLGTGLATLRERLKLAYGGEAQLDLTEVVPHGVCAEIVFPVREVAA